MRLLERWVRFNLVGLVGMIVQLGALAVLNHLLHGKYLLATALALEVALLILPGT
jgi:putative flippase GtrA